RFVALGVLELLKTAEDLASAFGAEPIALPPAIALLAVAESDQLDCPFGQGPGNVAADFPNRALEVLQQVVVAFRKPNRHDVVGLRQVKAAGLAAAIEVTRLGARAPQ